MHMKDSDIDRWRKRVEKASEFAVSEAFSHKKPHSGTISLSVALQSSDQLRDHDNAYSEAQALLGDWLNSKLRLELEMEEEDDLTGFVERRRPAASTGSLPSTLNCDNFDDLYKCLTEEEEHSAVDSFLQNLMEQEVLDFGMLEQLALNVGETRKKFRNPIVTMEARHQQVRENRARREAERQRQQREREAHLGAREEAKRNEREEEMRKKQEARRQEELIQQEMVRLRRQMEERRALKQLARQREREKEEEQRAARSLPSTQTLPTKQEQQGTEQLLKEQKIQTMVQMSNLKCLQRHFSGWYLVVLNQRLQLGKIMAICDWKRQLRAWRAWRAVVWATQKQREQQETRHKMAALINARPQGRSTIKRKKKTLKMNERNMRCRIVRLVIRLLLKVTKAHSAMAGEQKACSGFKSRANCSAEGGTEHDGFRDGDGKNCPACPAIKRFKTKQSQCQLQREENVSLPQMCSKVTVIWQIPTIYSVLETISYKSTVHKRDLKFNTCLNKISRERIRRICRAECNILYLLPNMWQQCFGSLPNMKTYRLSNSSTYLPVTSTHARKYCRIPNIQHILITLSEAMEARAHQRAERKKEIEELKKKKEEAKLAELKAAEEQRQREEEEEKRKAAEKRREEKRLEKEKEEEKQKEQKRQQELLKLARKHYHRTLLLRRGLVPWKRFTQLRQGNKQLAESHYNLILLRRCTLGWQQSARQSVSEKEASADQLHQHFLLRRSLSCWKRVNDTPFLNECCLLQLNDWQMIQGERAKHFYRSHTLRSFLLAWLDHVTDQRLVEWDHLELAQEHNKRRVLQQCFLAWRKLPWLLRKERERDKRREKLGRKVAEVLTDFFSNPL
ncbi:Coiled-coil domain-containing protein 191 [Channa argus]|uniref:Coiled-coil domain-containing protein 191 n=1 Tax=Channa argus TaxID=215402 RepID=A0A6G1QNF1_CHAAH|nr:Coiled-coil domain-containing protein 191 [Channa argus]